MQADQQHRNQLRVHDCIELVVIGSRLMPCVGAGARAGAVCHAPVLRAAEKISYDLFDSNRCHQIPRLIPLQVGSQVLRFR